MKTLLCYGDSNTWGYIPRSCGRYETLPEARYDWAQRWPGVAQSALGPSWRVLENGLNGRTTMFDDPGDPGRSGLAMLPFSVDIAKPFDAFAVMLGTNDLKSYFGTTPWEIALGMENIVQKLRALLPDAPPKILIIAPILVGTVQPGENMGMHFYPGCFEKAKGLAEAFATVAKRNACDFLNAADHAQPGVDGIHIDEAGHKALGEAVAKQLQSMFA